MALVIMLLGEKQEYHSNQRRQNVSFCSCQIDPKVCNWGGQN